jgi:hypothetical protein
MDLRREILKEHSKRQAHKVADYVRDNTKRFEDLVNVYLAGPYRVTQRSAWPLSLCVENHPELIKPHLKKVLDHLTHPDIHDSVKRNTMRLLQFVDIPKRFHGRVASTCFDYLQSNQEPVAVKVFSMAVLARIIEDQPDLKNELIIILEDQFPFATAAFRSRAKKVLKKLKSESLKRKAW